VKEVYRWNRLSVAIVDDLIQETYLKLCLNDFKALRRSEFSHEAGLFGFLKVVASNTAQDYFRRIFSPKRGGKAGEVAFDESAASFVSGQSVMRIDRAILIQEIDNYLLSVVNARSRCRDRLIFWAYYREGLTAKLISQLPGVGLGIKGVESAILRMTRQLKIVMNA
jgi:RNA polymerase sigma-70 factor (ECF subfamily)